MANRGFSPGGYKYGFNGKEKDDEVKGTGASYDYGFRIFDARLGKFLSVDPLAKSYPFYTPYQFAGNMPIAAIDLDGLEQYLVINYYNKAGELVRSIIREVRDENGNQVNRDYTTKDGVNHSSALVHRVDMSADMKIMKEEFADSFTKEEAKAKENLKKTVTLTIFKNAGGKDFPNAQVYEANIAVPVPAEKDHHTIVVKKDIDVSTTNGFIMATFYPQSEVGGSDMWDNSHSTPSHTASRNGSFLSGGEYAKQLDALISNIKTAGDIKSVTIEITLRQSPGGGAYTDAAMSFVGSGLVEQTAKYLKEVGGLKSITVTGSASYKPEVGKSSINIKANAK